MIKYQNGNFECEGTSIELLSDYGVVTTRLVEAITRVVPRERVQELIHFVVDEAIKIAGSSDEELQKQSRMMEVAKILRESEER